MQAISTPSATPTPDVRRRAIRLWLHAISLLVFAMVLVGGATRLTESGLSIVEWQPVTGTVPPLSEAAWQAEFDKYKTIPQYTTHNSGMTLTEFKTIYWWEWVHRLLGRLIGFAFLLPFLWFLWRRWIEPGLRGRLWAIFGLGALQGAVGWWMVASGLVGRTEVSQYRLATHLVLACLIYAAMVWVADGLGSRRRIDGGLRLRTSAIGLLVLVFVQIYFGALLAGLRGGLTYNTWPLIDGVLVPDGGQFLTITPVWHNFFENILTVQFEHRTVAYVLWLGAVVHLIDVTRTLQGGPALNGALALASAVTVQAVLGILTLLYVVPLSLALAHQAVALVVLTIAVLHVGTMATRQREASYDAASRAAPAGVK